MTRLPYDCERCYGSCCLIREACLRHAGLDDMGPRTPINDHSIPKAVVLNQDCQLFLKMNED